MNKVFRVIWNHATQTWTAVSELGRSKGKTKSSKLKKLSAAAIAVSSVVAATQAQAATELGHGKTGTNPRAQNGLVIGATDKVVNNGENGLVIGTDTASVGENGGYSVVVGYNVSSNETANVVIGKDINVENKNGGADQVLIGKLITSNNASGNASYAAVGIGLASTVSGYQNIAIGRSATSTGSINSIAIGTSSLASKDGATVIGGFAQGTDVGATAYGNSAKATQRRATAIGPASNATTFGGVALGYGANVQEDPLNAGRNTQATNQTALGYEATVSGDRATAVGGTSKAVGTNSVAVGYKAESHMRNGVALGRDAKNEALVESNYTYSGTDPMGPEDKKFNNTTLVITPNMEDDSAKRIGYAGSSIAVGPYAKVSNQSASSVVIGDRAATEGNSHYSVVVGRGSKAYASDATAIGHNAQVRARESIAIGTTANINGKDSIRSVAIGWGATVREDANDPLGKEGSYDAVAIGSAAQASAITSVALGAGSFAERGTSNKTAIAYDVTRERINDTTFKIVRDRQYGGNVEGIDPVERADAYAERADVWGRGPTFGEVSIGNDGNKRQLTNLAGGYDDYDAVNVAQLKNVNVVVKGDKPRKKNESDPEPEQTKTDFLVHSGALHIVGEEGGRITTEAVHEGEKDSKVILKFDASGFVKENLSTVNNEGKKFITNLGPIVEAEDNSITVNTTTDSTTGQKTYKLKANVQGGSGGSTTIKSGNEDALLVEGSATAGYTITPVTGSVTVTAGQAGYNATSDKTQEAVGKQLVNVSTLTNVVNNVSWNLQTAAVAGSNGTVEVVGDSKDAANVKAGNTVNINAGNGVKIKRTGLDVEISSTLEKGEIVPAGEKDPQNPTTTTGNGKVEAKTGDGDKYTTVNNVVNAINSSFWKVGDNDGTVKHNVTAGNQVNFVNGKGTTSNVTLAADGSNKISFDVAVDNDTIVVENGVLKSKVKPGVSTPSTWNVNATGDVNGTASVQTVNSGDTVNLDAGNNLVVTQNPQGKTGHTYSFALKDDITLGKNGVDGKDGSIGVNGKDGSAVAINGADGSIGLTGKDGANGVSIKGQDGKVGVDGKDGETRLVYVEKDNPGKTHEIATTDDGLHFGGDIGNTASVKLNKQVDIKGGETDASKLAKGNNIGVTTEKDEATGNATLKVQLAKNIDLGNDGSVTTGNTKVDNTGVTIKAPQGGTTSDVTLTATGLNNGGNVISNVAAGVKDTDAVNVSQLNKLGNNTIQLGGDASSVTATQTLNKAGGIKFDVVSGDAAVLKTVASGSQVAIDLTDDAKAKLNHVVKVEGKGGNVHVNPNTTKAGETVYEITVDAAQAVDPTKLADGTNTNVTGDGSATNPYKVNLNTTVDLTDAGSLKAGDTTVNNNGLTITGGPSVTKTGIDAGSKVINNVADGKVSADSKEAVNGSQLHAVKAAERHIKPDTYSVDNDGTVTMTYVDGEGNDVTGEAKITGIAKNDLSNITEGGKNVVKGLINMENGENTVASSRDVNGVKTFKVDVKGDLANITSVTGGTGTGKVAFAADQVVNVEGDKTIKLDAKTGDITGLTNVNLEAADFGTKGRAATEEQLKIVNDSKIGDNNIKLGGDTGTTDNQALSKAGGLQFNVKGGDNAKYVSTTASGTDVTVDLTQDTKDKIDNAANQSFNNINNDAKKVITGLGTIVKKGDNVTVDEVVDQTTGQRTYTINAVAQNLGDATLKYKANGENEQSVKVSEGLNFTNGDYTTATVDANGVVKYDVNLGDKPTVTDGKAGVPGKDGTPGKDGIATIGSVVELVNNIGWNANAGGNLAEGTSATSTTVKAGNTVNFNAGKNLTVEQTIATNGDQTYTYALSNDITVGAKGADGKDGVDGSIGVNGKDGSAVAINGKDGSIGLNGKDGANGVTIKGDQGPAGVNGKDGETKTRLIVNNEKVATLEDGLKFKGDDETVIAKKLNEQLDIVGGANKDELTENNIGVNSKDGKLNVQLAKNINLTDGGSIKFGDNLTINNGGLTIKDGPSITNKGIDAGNQKVTNVKAGDVSATSTDAVNGSQLHAVKAAERHIKPDTYSVDNDGTVTMTYVDGDGNAADGEAKITGIAKNDLSNITDGGKTVIQTEAKKAINVKGGKNADVKKTDEAGVDTYTVNVEGALTDITSITNNTGSGKVSFNPNGVVTVGEGNTAINFNGNTGDITGLTNVNLDAQDFGTKGRAATEEQLDIVNKKFNNTVQLGGDKSSVTDKQALNKEGGIKFDVVSGDAEFLTTVASGSQVAVDLTQAAKDKLNHTSSWTVKTSATDGSHNGDAELSIKDGKAVELQAGKNLTVTQTNENGNAKVEFALNDDITVGKDGKDGTPGKDGSIGVKGADGSAVAINGKDGSIGLNGKDGANGVTIKGDQGPAGVNGKDGETKTRLIVNNEKVATLEDGLKFKGDDETVIAKKLNEQLDIVGGANKDELTENNIGVNSKDGKLNVQLAKNINLTDGGSIKFGDNLTINNGGLTIKDGPSITNKGIDAGNQKVTNVKAGDVSATSTDAVNGSQLYQVKTDADKNRTTVQSSDNSIKVEDKGTAGKHEYDITVNNQGIVENAQVPVVYTKADGTKVYLQTDGTFNTAKDGKGEKVEAGDVIVSINNPANSTTDGNTIFNNIGSAIKNQEGNTYLAKLDKANDATPNAAVNVTDLKQTADALTSKGFGLTAEDGKDAKASLGETVTVKGDGSVTTKIVTEDGKAKLQVGLNKDITVGNDKEPGTITVKGKDGKDGVSINGENGSIGLKGEDGKDSITLNGKDGTIGLKGEDGKDGITLNGKDGTIGINGKDGSNGSITVAQGKAGVDGKDGETKTRLIVNNEEVSTLNDGLKFKGDDETVIAKKLNEQLDIVGGANKDELTENNIGVNSKDGKLNVQLAKNINLTDSGSIKFGDNLTINNGGLTIKDGPSITNKGIDAGNNVITNVTAGVADNDAVNVAQLKEVKAAERHIKPTKDGAEYTVNNDGDVTLTYVDGNGNDVADTKAVIKGIAKNDLSNITDGGKTVIQTEAKKAIKVVDGKNTKVTKGTDGTADTYAVNVQGALTDITSVTGGTGTGKVAFAADQVVNVAGDKTIKLDAKTGDITGLTNVNLDAKDFGTKGRAATEEQLDIVRNKGLVFDANSGGEKTNKLGSKVTVKGEGTKDDNEYSGENIKTVISQDDKGNTVIDVKLDKNLKTQTITVTGEPGKDGSAVVTVGEKGANGKDGVDGTIGVNGKDGSAVVINGKDGSIGLNGKDGANGVSIKGQAGKVGVDGKDGETRLVYVEKDNPGKTHEIATTDDGLKFTGNNEVENNHKLNSKVTIKGEGVTKAQSENFKSAKGNINVKADGKGTLEVQLAKNVDLGNDGSVTTGKTVVNNNGVTITNTDPTKTVSVTENGLNNGGNQIKGVAEGTDDTDAVNVGQLKRSVGDVYNKMNNHRKEARAGIAGANAAAGLPQVYQPGKSMVAASAGTFKGQNALAVGYSRSSDNGKVILKLQGNANSQGDFGGSVGVGYQW